MRNMNVSLEMAELAVDFRDRGVVGFDLAGEEGGYPPKKHVEAFHYIQRMNFNITIHAGEGYGKESIWQAIQYCGAHRIGHGTRLIEDIAIADGKAVKLGDLAQYVLDKRIPLEICLLSNVHTGATPSLAEHPFRIYYQEKFRVTLNTDNRLMSDTSMTQEFEAAADTFGLSLDDFEKITINAMKSAFLTLQTALRHHLFDNQTRLCQGPALYFIQSGSHKRISPFPQPLLYLPSREGYIHVPKRALWPDPGRQRAEQRPLAASNQESHDRQTSQAYRPGSETKGKNTLPAGTVLWAVFLRRAEHPLV